MIRLSRFPLLLVATALLAGAPMVPAQEQQEAPPQAGEPSSDDRPRSVFVDSMSVDVVNVDVYVRDNNGDPVRGLTADDFEMSVDGRPVPISNFYAVESSPEEASEQQSAEAPAEDSPDVYETAGVTEVEPTPQLPPDQRLHVVIYIDNYNLTPFKRNQVLRDLRQFLRTELTSQDRVMLATYDRSLHLRHPFTATPENLNAMLIEIEEISAQRIHLDRERVEVLRQIEDADTVSEALMYANNLAGSIRNDTSFTIDAMRSIVDNLAASPGRKAIIYVSEGLPLIPGEDLFQQVQLKFKEGMSMNYIYEYDLSRRFDELANQANANRVSFYTIDARGLTVISQGTVDYDIKGQAGERQLIDQTYTSNVQSSIQLLADRTGGQSVINTNRFLPDLKEIAQDFRNYYSLGYTTAEGASGRYHRIEVKLKDKPRGWSIRHRDGYRSKSVETRMHDGTLSALNLDMQDNPLDVQLQFGQPQRTADGLFNVPLHVVIPFDRLTLLPNGEYRTAKLRLWLAAKDEQDKMSDMQTIPLDLNVPVERMPELAGKPMVKTLNLTMDAGYNDVAIGLRDDIGQQRSFLRRGIAVGQGS